MSEATVPGISARNSPGGPGGLDAAPAILRELSGRNAAAAARGSARRLAGAAAGSLLRVADRHHEPDGDKNDQSRRCRDGVVGEVDGEDRCGQGRRDRKSTRLNSSHVKISYAVFCLKKKKNEESK